MERILKLLVRKALYFTVFIFLLVGGGWLIFTTNKIDLFLVLNRFHQKTLDSFFLVITFLGDGLCCILLSLILLLKKPARRLSLTIFSAYLVSGFVAQILKHTWSAPRPREIINTHLYHSFINGVTGAGWDSFPSGHTTSIFALATVLAMHFKQQAAGLGMLIIAILVGYSRIYLGQHFLQDVAAGAVLGTISGLVAFIAFHDAAFTEGNEGNLKPS
jgi:membrane-associated phospholipid phosphatase